MQEKSGGDFPLCLKKAALVAAFFLPLNFLLAQTKTVSTDVGFVPQMGGSFKANQRNYFYVGREKKLVILDDRLRIMQTIQLLTETAAIDFADLNADGSDELIEFTQSAIYRRNFSNEKFSDPHAIIHERLALPLYVENLEQSRLAIDYDKDGYSDLFLPSEGKFVVYHNDAGKRFRKETTLAYKPHGSFTNRLWQNSDLPSNTIRSTVLIPQPMFHDFNNDGIVDAAARIDERIYYFMSGGKNQQPFAETILRIYPIAQEDIYVAYAEFCDFDNDGELDLIYSTVKGLGLNIRVEIRIFKSHNFIPEPRRVIEHAVQGGVFSPLIASLRGRKLLLQPTIDTGIGFFMNYILRSRVSLTLQLIDPLTTKDNPLEKTTLSFDSKESAVPGFTYGDFTGDGKTDFILGTEINGITVYGGNDDLSKKEIAHIDAPAYGIFKTVTDAKKESWLFIFMTQRSKADKKTAVYLAPIVTPASAR